jgi:hypothetical protein
MKFSTLYWWEWLAYLFGFSSIIINALWLSTTFRKRPMPNGEPLSSPTLPNSRSIADLPMPPMRPRGRVTVWIGLPVILLMGLAGGYAIRDHQLITNQQTYTDVAVLRKISDSEFLIWPDRMKQQHIQICAGSTVGWYEGEVLNDWTFEQRKGCKRVISYHEKQKGEIDASIQTR